jgi:DNA repair protein RecN (Recombination protein N)
MLGRLTVRNYLLIDRLDLELGPGLTVITGETGSGKSILIGALGLLLGDRAEGELLRDPSKRCVVEMESALAGLPAGVPAWCRENGLPVDDPLVLRRQLEPGGRSRAFVNDTPVRLEQLRELGGMLVHVHSQHQALLLHSAAFHLGLVDQFAGTTAEARELAEAYQAWHRVKEQLEQAREEAGKAAGERDFLEFQHQELQAARLQAGEGEQLEQALARTEHAGEIATSLESLEQGIRSERGAGGQLAGLRQSLAKAARLDPAIQALLERLRAVGIELEDMAGEAAKLQDALSLDPRDAERLRERWDLLVRLQHKHRVPHADALIALREELGARLAHMNGLDSGLKELENREAELLRHATQRAQALSEKRQQVLVPVSQEAERRCHELGLPDAVFRFEHAATELRADGLDRVRALFSANKDRAAAPLERTASGGELGRVMLVLIGMSAASKEWPTVIFDEIDTGVSGETADRVGAQLQAMARQRQVIAISHLPQMASKADTHLLVTKETVDAATESRIRPLDATERVEALARMLSGKKIGKAAVENAKALLKDR